MMSVVVMLVFVVSVMGMVFHGLMFMYVGSVLVVW